MAKRAAGTVAVITLIAASGVAFAIRGTLSLPIATTHADGGPDGPPAAARRIVQPLLAEYPGLAVAVVGPEGGVLWAEGFGYADLASRQARNHVPGLQCLEADRRGRRGAAG